jgi:hypothetical protein
MSHTSTAGSQLLGAKRELLLIGERWNGNRHRLDDPHI